MSRLDISIREKLMSNRMPATVGKLKVGEKRLNKNGKEYPVSLDYFVAKSKFEKYENTYNEVIGEKVNNLKIKFDSDNTNKVCFEYAVFRNSAGQKVAYGDGKEYKEYNSDTHKWIKSDLDTKQLMNKYKCEPKIEFGLVFRLVELENVGFFGNWIFETRGVASSIPAITQTFDLMVLEANKRNLDFKEFEFDLNVKYHISNNVDKSKYSVVSLIPNFYDKFIKTQNNLLTSNKVGLLNE
jgi:hypothetical protein